MPKTRGGRKRTSTNLEVRRKNYEALSADKQRSMKRPGSHKK